jgi:HAD superfamily hydrolase (TIGR01450 family)
MNSRSTRLTGSPTKIQLDSLLSHYYALLLDAYGVLVDKTGPLPGAMSLIDRLNSTGHPYLVLTNSASRLPETLAREFAEWKLNIPTERILTSGMLLAPYFREKGLRGSSCVVLGTHESRTYLTRAGGRVLPLGENVEAGVVVIADQKGFQVMESMNRVLSLILRCMDTGQHPPELLLCNPDLIYPISSSRYGFTAGGLAAMLEAVLNERYAERGLSFFRLGKPHTPIFEEAMRRLGTQDLVMLGDQLATDILGANRVGIDSVLVRTGLARGGSPSQCEAVPTWFIENLLDR